MSFPRYERYKGSGVEWLGEVPAHWELNPLKRLCDVRPSNVDKKSYDGEADVQLCNYTDVYHQEQILSSLPFMEATATPAQIARFGLRAGDVIITKDSETADDIAIAAYVPETLPTVVCGYHLALLRPFKGTSGPFIKRFFDSAFAKSQVQVRANGLTRVGLGQYALNNLMVATPPLDEQVLIADHLDRETAKIDALVEAQQRLIELLKEKRQAVISHAVTKGLDPSASMKDSGVGWLGQVPAHWRVLPFGRVIERIEQGWSPTAHERPPELGEASVLRLSAIKNGQFRAEERKALPYVDEAELRAAPLVQAGDFFITRANTPELVGDCAIASGVTDTIFSDLIYRLTFSSAVSSDFILLTLRSSPTRGQIRRDARGSSMSMAKLSHSHLKSWIITVPPTEEQDAIVKEVSKIVSSLEKLIQEAKAAITLLQERRAALISAAVTGKIDVRGLAAAPQQAEAA